MIKLYAFIILIAVHIFGCLIHTGQTVSIQILTSTNTEKGNLALRVGADSEVLKEGLSRAQQKE